jgi:hypothetical protein
MGYNPLNISYDQATQGLIANTSGSWSSMNVPTLKFYRNDDYKITLNVYNSAPTQANLASINTSSWVLDVGTVGSNAVLSRDTTTATWDSSNVSSGVLIVYTNTYSSALTSALGTDASKTYTMQFSGTDDSIGNQQLIAILPILAKNIVN